MAWGVALGVGAVVLRELVRPREQPARLIDWAFGAWARSKIENRKSKIDRALFQLARGYYYWRGVRDALQVARRTRLQRALTLR